MKMKSFST